MVTKFEWNLLGVISNDFEHPVSLPCWFYSWKHTHTRTFGSVKCFELFWFDPSQCTFGVRSTQSCVEPSFEFCVGCDIVQADHAPEAGVAQGVFHGVLVRHHGRIQEEVEEGLEDEVERHKEEENTQEQVRMPMTMDGNEDTDET